MGRSRGVAEVLSGIHVLLVEDDEDTSNLLRTILEYCGALVTWARSARAALEVLQRITPDILVSDISMPDEDGYWLLRNVRALPATHGCNIPVVALTAFGTLHGPDRTLAAGFQAHVRKPVDPWDLSNTLASLVRKP